MVSHPENGSDSPIGSDRDRGRDSCTIYLSQDLHVSSFKQFYDPLQR